MKMSAPLGCIFSPRALICCGNWGCGQSFFSLFASLYIWKRLLLWKEKKYPPLIHCYKSAGCFWEDLPRLATGEECNPSFSTREQIRGRPDLKTPLSFVAAEKGDVGCWYPKRSSKQSNSSHFSSTAKAFNKN